MTEWLQNKFVQSMVTGKKMVLLLTIFCMLSTTPLVHASPRHTESSGMALLNCKVTYTDRCNWFLCFTTSFPFLLFLDFLKVFGFSDSAFGPAVCFEKDALKNRAVIGQL